MRTFPPAIFPEGPPASISSPLREGVTLVSVVGMPEMLTEGALHSILRVSPAGVVLPVPSGSLMAVAGFLFLTLKVGRVEVVVPRLLDGSAGGRCIQFLGDMVRRKRFVDREGVLGVQKPFTGSGIGEGEFLLLRCKLDAMPRQQVPAPERADAHPHQLLDVVAHAGD